MTDIQKSGLLKQIILAAQAANEKMALAHGVEKKPIVIKLGPLTNYETGTEYQKDLTVNDLGNIVNVCDECKVDGIVTTNTSSEHDGIPE